MSNLEYLNLSTDLRRISVWLVEKRVKLAEPFIKKSLEAFGKNQKIVGKKKVGEWLRGIAAFRLRGWKSAEDALTLSVMLKNRFAHDP